MKTPSKSTVILLLAAACVALFSASCATVRGFGRDVGTAGEGIEKSTR